MVLKALGHAEEVVGEMLSSQKLTAFGFTSPSDSKPTVIPAHHWHFLPIDFDEGKAKREDLEYVGIKAIAPTELSNEMGDSLLGSEAAINSRAEESQPLGSDLFVEYREMENRSWHEVSIALVAGDLIKILVRGKVKRFSYAYMGLVDKRIDKGILNRQDTTLLSIAF